MEISPRRVRNTKPFTPTMSPMSHLRYSANASAPDVVGFDVNLHLAAFVDKVDEVGLAHIAAGQDAAGDDYVAALKRVERVADGFEVVRFVKSADDERVLAVRAQLGELFPADAQDVAQILFGFGGGAVLSSAIYAFLCFYFAVGAKIILRFR